MIKDINLLPWQDDFIFGTTDARYRAAICGIGTGKTFAYLFDAITACLSGEQEENIVVIRRTYKSLVDSTLVDLNKYFNLTVHSQKKSIEFPKTKSIIRFLHGDAKDISNLTNMSLTRFYIEQAEEFEDGTVFKWLSDRLRGGNKCYGVVIANAKGHNWVWDEFVAGAECEVLNKDTEENIYRKQNHACMTGSSYANPYLPKDYIAYLDEMKVKDYKRWLRLVMNSFDVEEEANSVFSAEEIMSMQNPPADILRRQVIGRVMGVDIARFGSNSNVAKICDVFYDGAVSEIITESWQGLDGVYTQGKIFDLINRYKINAVSIDADGLGGPVLDNVRALCNNNISGGHFLAAQPPKVIISEYHNTVIGAGPYANVTTRAYFTAKDMAGQGKLFLKDKKTISELSARKYLYNHAGQKILEGKKEWNNGDGTSPDYADSAVMAVEAAKLVKAKIASAPMRIVRRAEPVRLL